MRFTVERNEGIVIFTLKSPKLTSENSANMKAELLIVCQPDISALVIDLTLVDFVDSSGLGALLLAYRQLKDHDIPIVLTGVNDMVKKMLEISQIFDLFEYSDTVDEAINI